MECFAAPSDFELLLYSGKIQLAATSGGLASIYLKTHFRANSLEVEFPRYYRKEKKIQLAATSGELELIKRKTHFKTNSQEVGL